MSVNPLKEKGIPIDEQLRSWGKIARSHYDKDEIEAYTRTRQILMNGIEVEAWNFKHNFLRTCSDLEINKVVSKSRRIEDMQQATVNWLAPSNQTVLETTLGYEQVAVDLTAWLAQNEPDKYVKETFDFGLLEDFDHLYRYSQWAYMLEDLDPNKILQGLTDVFLGRPTQNHHNDNSIRLRKHYDKKTVKPQTRVNILTLLSGEQQTHNYYAEHGFQYANPVLRTLYAEIKDVEEEHVTMYGSLIDPTESAYEKLLVHEFCEVCNYYTCLKDETNEKIKLIWEEFLDYEIGHLHYAAELFEKHEKRDAQEVIGTKIIEPSHFKSQKEYVGKILKTEVDKRLDGKASMGYTKIEKLSEDWKSYYVQEIVNGEGAPSEMTIRVIATSEGRDLVLASEDLRAEQVNILSRGLEPLFQAPDTLSPEQLQYMIDKSEDSIKI